MIWKVQNSIETSRRVAKHTDKESSLDARESSLLSNENCEWRLARQSAEALTRKRWTNGYVEARETRILIHSQWHQPEHASRSTIYHNLGNLKSLKMFV